MKAKKATKKKNQIMIVSQVTEEYDSNIVVEEPVVIAYTKQEIPVVINNHEAEKQKIQIREKQEVQSPIILSPVLPEKPKQETPNIKPYVDETIILKSYQISEDNKKLSKPIAVQQPIPVQQPKIIQQQAVIFLPSFSDKPKKKKAPEVDKKTTKKSKINIGIIQNIIERNPLQQPQNIKKTEQPITISQPIIQQSTIISSSLQQHQQIFTNKKQQKQQQISQINIPNIPTKSSFIKEEVTIEEKIINQKEILPTIPSHQVQQQNITNKQQIKPVVNNVQTITPPAEQIIQKSYKIHQQPKIIQMPMTKAKKKVQPKTLAKKSKKPQKQFGIQISEQISPSIIADTQIKTQQPLPSSNKESLIVQTKIQENPIKTPQKQKIQQPKFIQQPLTNNNIIIDKSSQILVQQQEESKQKKQEKIQIFYDINDNNHIQQPPKETIEPIEIPKTVQENIQIVVIPFQKPTKTKKNITQTKKGATKKPKATINIQSIEQTSKQLTIIQPSQTLPTKIDNIIVIKQETKQQQQHKISQQSHQILHHKKQQQQLPPIVQQQPTQQVINIKSKQIKQQQKVVQKIQQQQSPTVITIQSVTQNPPISLPENSIQQQQRVQIQIPLPKTTKKKAPKQQPKQKKVTKKNIIAIVEAQTFEKKELQPTIKEQNTNKTQSLIQKNQKIQNVIIIDNNNLNNNRNNKVDIQIVNIPVDIPTNPQKIQVIPVAANITNLPDIPTTINPQKIQVVTTNIAKTQANIPINISDTKIRMELKEEEKPIQTKLVQQTPKTNQVINPPVIIPQTTAPISPPHQQIFTEVIQKIDMNPKPKKTTKVVKPDKNKPSKKKNQIIISSIIEQDVKIPQTLPTQKVQQNIIDKKDTDTHNVVKKVEKIVQQHIQQQTTPSIPIIINTKVQKNEIVFINKIPQQNIIQQFSENKINKKQQQPQKISPVIIVQPLPETVVQANQKISSQQHKQQQIKKQSKQNIANEFFENQIIVIQTKQAPKEVSKKPLKKQAKKNQNPSAQIKIEFTEISQTKVDEPQKNIAILNNSSGSEQIKSTPSSLPTINQSVYEQVNHTTVKHPTQPQSKTLAFVAPKQQKLKQVIPSNFQKQKQKQKIITPERVLQQARLKLSNNEKKNILRQTVCMLKQQILSRALMNPGKSTYKQPSPMIDKFLEENISLKQQYKKATGGKTFNL